MVIVQYIVLKQEATIPMWLLPTNLVSKYVALLLIRHIVFSIDNASSMKFNWLKIRNIDGFLEGKRDSSFDVKPASIGWRTSAKEQLQILS